MSAAEVRLGPKGAAVLFDASMAQMAELEAHREAFRKLGLEIAAQSGHGSGWIVFDAKRTVIARYDASYSSAAILIHQFGWTPPEPAAEVEGKQLTARLHASNSEVAPGERIALGIDVDLEPGMHVYAPGVEGYIPIDWKMEDSGQALMHDAVFPRAEKLYLKAIDETVPAYRDHFRLIRDITIAPGAAGGFVVDGSLRYQACDDRLCYIPQTLHLHWTFDRRGP
jgi:DsbC/DsbD-like thiol-disulfide interchange protein